MKISVKWKLLLLTAAAITGMSSATLKAEICAICFEEIDENSDTRYRFGCPHAKHVFHAECIDPWLNLHNGTCPLCRAEPGLPLPLWTAFQGPRIPRPRTPQSLRPKKKICKNKRRRLFNGIVARCLFKPEVVDDNEHKDSNN